MTYNTHYYCAGCREEILSSHAFKHKGKLYCGKECLYQTLDIEFVWLEEE